MSGPGLLAGPVLFVGTAAGFSAQVLTHLLARDAPIAAVVVPDTHWPVGRRRELPVTVPGAGISVTDLARDARLPVETLAPDLAAPGFERLAGYRPAATLVACFPRRIPMAFCRLAAEGCFNLHPSLLPAYRGPAPLFWQFRNGEPRGGITVHRLTGTLDAGPIALQAPYRLVDGLTEPRANGDLARLGGELYLELLARIRRRTLTLQAQDEARATHYGWPTAEDFHLAPTWSARRAYNFMRGAASWGRPFAVATHAGTLWVHEAVAWFPEGASPAPAGPDTLDLAFAGGVVRVRPVVPG